MWTVITGYVYDNTAHITMCDVIMNWNDVTKRMRHLLLCTYGQNCECQVCFEPSFLKMYSHGYPKTYNKYIMLYCQ